VFRGHADISRRTDGGVVPWGWSAAGVFIIVIRKWEARHLRSRFGALREKALLRRLGRASGVPLHPPGKRTISVAMLREGFRFFPEASHPQDSRRMFRCFGHTSLKALLAPKCAERKIRFKVLLGQKPTAWANLAPLFLIHNSCANLFMRLRQRNKEVVWSRTIIFF